MLSAPQGDEIPLGPSFMLYEKFLSMRYMEAFLNGVPPRCRRLRIVAWPRTFSRGSPNLGQPRPILATLLRSSLQSGSVPDSSDRPVFEDCDLNDLGCGAGRDHGAGEVPKALGIHFYFLHGVTVQKPV
jgi:hypothetical protein